MTSPALDVPGECVQHLPGTNRGLVTALRTGWQHLAEEAMPWSQVLVVGGTFLNLPGALGCCQGFQNKCEVQLCPVQIRKNRSCSFSVCFALSMLEVFFFLSLKSFVSEDDLHLLFFPMNSSGAKFSVFSFCVEMCN